MRFREKGTMFAGVFLESMCVECVRSILEAPSSRLTSPKIQPSIVSNNGGFSVTIHVDLILTARTWHGSFDFKGSSEQGIHTKDYPKGWFASFCTMVCSGL